MTKAKSAEPQRPDFENMRNQINNGISITTGIGYVKQCENYISLLEAQLATPPADKTSSTLAEPMTWAEGLIRQLPDTHEGRNSWLMNHGVSSNTIMATITQGDDMQHAGEDDAS